MSKVGRNDPCPCGSGKKYKKCCLEKDQARQAAERELVGLRTPSAPTPVFTPPLPEMAMRPEDEAADERWDRFEAAGWDERAKIFQEALVSGTLESDEAFEMLNELRAGAGGEAERTTFFHLLFELRVQAPQLYHQDFGFYNVWLAEDLLERRQPRLLPEALEPFARDPERFPDEFSELIRLLMYHGAVSPLLPAMRRAWPILERSSKVMGWAIDEFAEILSALTIYEYVDSTPHPRPDDPTLVEALGKIGTRDAERDRLNVLSLLGQLSEALRPADFSSAVGKDVLYRNLTLLSMGWLGDQHRRHGISLAKGELARQALMPYLGQHAEGGKRGETLLVPQRQSLQPFLHETLFARLDGIYPVGSLLELLPRYVDYLVQQELVESGRGGRIVEDLRGVQQALLAEMKDYGHPAVVIRAIERAWRDTALTPEGRIRHDAIDLDELLMELRQAGQVADRDLLDRVAQRGQAAVSPLIAMATDRSLHFADQKSPDVWAPLHAIQLLGELQVAEAIEPLLPLFTWDDDWLAEALPECFGRIGRPALAPMRSLLFDRTKDVWTRARAGHALACIAQYHPDLRSDVVEALEAQLNRVNGRESDAEVLNGFIVSRLLDLKAVQALPAIRRVFDENRIDDSIVDMEGVERELGV